MPLYEYQCPQCGRFERIQKFSDPLLTECPTCGKPVQKLLSAPAIQFKGTGWYITDYAKKSGGVSGGSGSGDSKGEAKSSDSKSDAKSDTGTPSTSTSKDSPASGSGSAS